MDQLTLDTLTQAVAGSATAIRSVTRLQPAGGPGDKVFPPTYNTGDNTLKYAVEQRRVDGQTVQTVLLDSVASQANRMEEALLAAWDADRELVFPVIAVNFSDAGKEVGDIGRITTLDAPHRFADALLRDSVDENGTRFRDTEPGAAITDASVRNATAVYSLCPTALIFGVWDSTGPKGGLGNKFQRAIVSEIVAFGAVHGNKTSSRIDPLGIQANVTVYHRKDNSDDWTIDEGQALIEKGKAKVFSRKSGEGKGRPSAINHGNIAPSIDEFAGGVTFDYAQQTTVLSLPALRRLRFPRNVTNAPIDGDERREGELAARTALAALALAAVAHHRDQGFDLRSRSCLVPDPGGPLALEVLPADGGAAQQVALTSSGASELLKAAHKKAAATGFGWNREPVVLLPSEKLVALIKKSRELAATGLSEASEVG